MSDLIRVHDICEYSRANGPGVRAVVWTQGCSIGCPGCFNQSTHSDGTGKLYDPVSLGEELGKLKVDGLTVSGGEPLEQPKQVLELVNSYRRFSQGTTLLFTGFTIAAILKNDLKRQALLQFDAAITGPYIKDSNEIWKGKKLALISNRIKPEELHPQRKVELTIGNEDILHVSGFPTEKIRSILHNIL